MPDDDLAPTVSAPRHLQTTRVRYWYMDTLRAYLMLGGVFYHAALVYSPHIAWRIHDPGTNPFFDIVVITFTSFRMPAFFLMAGFFCSLLFLRDNPKLVVRRRLVSLGLPFLTMLLSLQLAQYALKLIYTNHYPPATWQDFISGYVVTGAFISHLWFLLNLIIYYLAAGYILSNSWLHAKARTILDHPLLLRCLRNKSACTIGASGAIVIIDRTIGSWGIANAYTIDTVFRYLPFFAAGALVYMRPTLFEAFLRTRTADWVLLAIAAAIRYFWPNAGAATIISGEIVYYQAGFLFTILVVRLSRKYMNNRTSTQQDLVDAAFSIYLFHHICVIAVAMVILGYAPTMNVFLKYAIVVGIGCFVPYVFHAAIIRRYPRMRLLFNGRTRTSSA